MNGFVGLLLLIFGLVGALSPQTAWYMSIGWKFKDAEPSDAALGMHRVSGVLLTIIGLIVLVSSCASMFNGSSGNRWERELDGRIDAGEVTGISFGFMDEFRLNDDELQEVTAMLRDARLEPFTMESSYGYNNSGTITFNNGDKVDIIIGGPGGYVTLHPSGSTKSYRVVSNDLDWWIRSNATQ